MIPMTMTCVCTEEVSSVTLILKSNQAIFSTTTHRVLDDGTELHSEAKTEHVELTAEVIAAVMALKPTLA